ncbi:hypothetical protein [Thalassomonas actiniarum]|uniref:Uncharacterized protein n=1 Tax=Thalassomonas actiniarum TaxID=485447 RepID=A0AAE9YNT5_9GAMM|nr:hypothetical protein [Thalassomonas actiniarum]WDD97738.1 hypothetical protein SG35_020905 [Thalassomonas actiniarum]
MYEKLLKFWKMTSKELNIEIDIGHSLVLSSGTQIESLFLVKNFGAEKGMLILPKGLDIVSYQDEINQLGYGYSFLSEPFDNEEYSVEDYAELLDDWGWSGDPALKPFEFES